MKIVTRNIYRQLLVSKVFYNFSKTTYPFNINQEEHANYLKKVQKAEKRLDEADKINSVPRRQRRVYDRPKHNLDLTNYTAWRVYKPE